MNILEDLGFFEIFLILLILSTPFIWLIFSVFKIVDANEMGIRVIFGKVDPNIYDGGVRLFMPCWPAKLFKCYLKKYPISAFNLDYTPVRVITQEGNYKGKHYGSVQIYVKFMAYLSFPREREMLVNKETEEPVCFLNSLTDQERRDLAANGEIVLRSGVTLILEKLHPLTKIFLAGVLRTNYGLKDWSSKIMTSSVRAACARVTWMEANEHSEDFVNGIMESLLKLDSELIKAGFRPSGINLTVTLVDLPGEIKDAQADGEAAKHVGVISKN